MHGVIIISNMDFDQKSFPKFYGKVVSISVENNSFEAFFCLLNMIFVSTIQAYVVHTIKHIHIGISFEKIQIEKKSHIEFCQKTNFILPNLAPNDEKNLHDAVKLNF